MMLLLWEKTAFEAAIEGVAIKCSDGGTANEATVERATARVLGTGKEWEELYETLLRVLVGGDLIYVKEDYGKHNENPEIRVSNRVPAQANELPIDLEGKRA